MRSVAPRAQVDESPARKYSATRINQTGERGFLQRGENLRLPFIASRVWVFCVDTLLRVDQAGLNFFQAVGLFPDVFDLLDSGMAALQQAYRLLAAGISLRVGTLRLGMIFILN